MHRPAGQCLPVRGHRWTMRIPIVGTLLFVLALTSLASGQAPPDFSGRWVVIPQDPPEKGRTYLGQPVVVAPERSFGSGFTAVQDSTTLAIDRELAGRPWRVIYNLDGPETRNNEGPFVMVSTARWKGSVLVVSTRLADKDAVQDNMVTRELSLNADGTMIVRTKAGKRDFPDTIYRRVGER